MNDLSEILRGLENQWVALSHDEKKVVAADFSLGAAKQKALKKGERHPVLVKVPAKSGGYVLFNRG